MTHYLYTRAGGFIGDITPHVQRYQHELTNLGPYRASFRIETSEDVDLDQLNSWYETMLMNQFETSEGGVVVWSGYIWEVSLEARGFTRQRSMETVVNRVKVSMSDPDDSSITLYTAWHEDEESQALYGVHEDIQSLNGKGSIAFGADGSVLRNTATGAPIYEHDWYAQGVLESYARPLAGYSGDSAGYEPEDRDVGVLNVVCVGRSMLANNVKLSDGWLVDSGIPDGTNLRDSGLEDYESTAHSDGLIVSEEIRRIVGVINTNGGWLYELNIEQTNNVATVAGVSNTQGAMDRLQELAGIPDFDNRKYEIFVHKDGGFEYRRQTKEGQSFLYPNGSWVRGNQEPIGWYADATPIKVVSPRISLMAESDLIRPKRVSVANGEARFSESLERTELDMKASLRANRQWLIDAGKKKEE